MSVPAKKSSQIDETLAELRKHAFLLFARHGYDGVSVGDIARHAKLSKGALYWHFTGKEALFLDCLNRLQEIVLEAIFTPMSRADTGVKGIVVMFSGVVQLFADEWIKSGISGFFLLPNSSETTGLLLARQRHELECREIIKATLARAVTAGEIAIDEDLDVFARTVFTVVESSLLPVRRITPEQLKEHLGVLARTLFRAYSKNAATVTLVERL